MEGEDEGKPATLMETLFGPGWNKGERVCRTGPIVGYSSVFDPNDGLHRLQRRVRVFPVDLSVFGLFYDADDYFLQQLFVFHFFGLFLLSRTRKCPLFDTT